MISSYVYRFEFRELTEKYSADPFAKLHPRALNQVAEGGNITILDSDAVNLVSFLLVKL